jgi:hypothetical protein
MHPRFQYIRNGPSATAGSEPTTKKTSIYYLQYKKYSGWCWTHEITHIGTTKSNIDGFHEARRFKNADHPAIRQALDYAPVGTLRLVRVTDNDPKSVIEICRSGSNIADVLLLEAAAATKGTAALFDENKYLREAVKTRDEWLAAENGQWCGYCGEEGACDPNCPRETLPLLKE